MSMLVQLSYAQFMQHYAAVVQRFDLAELPADTQVLYVPAHAHEVVELSAHGHVCVIAEEYAQMSVVSDAVRCTTLLRLYAHQNASIVYTSVHMGSGEQEIELFL